MATRVPELENFDNWFYNRVLDGTAYHACSTGVVTLSTVATTITGLVIHNDPGTGKDLVINEFTFAPSTAPAGAAPVGLNIAPGPEAALTSVTAMVIHNALASGSDINTNATAAVGKVSSAATSSGTPVWFRAMSGVVAGSSLNPTRYVAQMKGSLILQPGMFCALGYLTTAVIGIAGVSWAEVETDAP